MTVKEVYNDIKKARIVIRNKDANIIYNGKYDNIPEDILNSEMSRAYSVSYMDAPLNAIREDIAYITLK